MYGLVAVAVRVTSAIYILCLSMRDSWAGDSSGLSLDAVLGQFLSDVTTNMGENNAPGLSVVTALFFCWSASTFSVRAWVKLRRREQWGWDDSSITAALAFALLHVVCVFLAIHDGYGVPIASLADSARNEAERSIFASQIFYIISIGLSKISTGLFIGHLTRHGPQRKLSIALSLICTLWTAASILFVSLRGDLRQPWQVLDGSSMMFIRWIVIEATGLAVEIGLWGLSINIIWTLSMALSKRVTILAIFGCRLLLIPLVAIRLYYLAPSQNPEPGLTSKTANIMTEAVIEFAFISASVTCLKPFLKPFHSSYVVSSVGQSGTGWRSGVSANSKDPYYALSAIHEADKDGAVTTIQDKGNIIAPSSERPGVRKSFRPDHFGQQVTVSAEAERASVCVNPEQMIIRKTETWSVRFEEGQTPAQDSSKGSDEANSQQLTKDSKL